MKLEISHLLYREFTIYLRKSLLSKVQIDQLEPKLDAHIDYCLKNSQHAPFRSHIDFYSIGLSIGVYPKQKEIYIANERCSSELSILTAQKLNDNNVDDELISFVGKITDLKAYNSPTDTEFYAAITDLIDLMELHKKNPKIDQDTFQKVEKLAYYQNSYKQSVFEKLSDFSLSLTARYAIIRIHLLKFLAILTSLEHDLKGQEVKRILRESLRRLLVDNKKAKRKKLKGDLSSLPLSYIYLFKLSYFITEYIPSNFLAAVVRFCVRYMARRFIAGENIVEALETVEGLSESNRSATLDQLGELVVSEAEADEYYQNVIELIEGLESKYQGEKNDAGIYLAHVSIKVSALCSDFKPFAFDYTYGLVEKRLKNILIMAKKSKVFINVDAEHYSYRDLVFNVYKKILLSTEELSNYDQTGIVVQAYLRDSHSHFKDILSLAKERGLRMPIRLVKGAYWDAETIEARAHNFRAPQFLNKEESDIRFRQLIYKSFENSEFINVAIASHNIHDHCWAESLRENEFPEHNPLEHQCLHMTYEALSVGLSQMPWATRNYVPVGNLLVGMAYLVRRIMENSSQVGILTIMRSHKQLDKYTGPLDALELNKNKGHLAQDGQVEDISSDFFPASPFRPYLKEHLQLVNDCKLDFNINTGDTPIYSNLDMSKEIGKVKFYTADETQHLIDKMSEQSIHEDWSQVSYRVAVLLEAAEMLHFQRIHLSKLIMEEAGKSLMEAFADVDEAIDFINFYTRDFLKRYSNNKDIKPKGLVGVIAPWNFPLAIPCGMTVAALITGNKVILKSSEKSPLVAQAMIDIFHHAGVPSEVLAVITGLGPSTGQVLSESNKVHNIVFTGSKRVGELLIKEGGVKLIANEDHSLSPRHVIAEMGGKNAIIVTNNCELDETVSGILYSSFAHAGQKCSACSRIIVDNKVKESFVKRFVAACRDLKVAPANDHSSFVNNIISKTDKDRILSDIKGLVEEAESFQGRVLIDRSNDPDLHPLAVGPVVVELPMERALEKNSYAQKEMFAPIVHIIGFDKLEQAILLFNSTEYALTGGVYAQSQDDIDFLSGQLRVGNLYINRPNTGARVAIEPFGGFKKSGTGPKAGGFNYLDHFMNYKEDFIIEEPHEFIAGSEYIYYTPEAWKKSFNQRLEICNSLVTQLLKKFDMFFAGQRPETKFKLDSYKKWLNYQAYEFLNEPQDNYKTPGQLNKAQYLSSHLCSLVVAYNDLPSFRCLEFIFNSILTGNGILVLCRTQKSYVFYSELSKLFYSLKVDKKNFEINMPTLERLHEALKSQSFSYQFIDSNLETTQVVMEKSFESESFHSDDLKKIFSNFNSYNDSDFTDFAKLFFHERSLAINTMRHGAPLDLEF